MPCSPGLEPAQSGRRRGTDGPAASTSRRTRARRPARRLGLLLRRSRGPGAKDGRGRTAGSRTSVKVRVRDLVVLRVSRLIAGRVLLHGYLSTQCKPLHLSKSNCDVPLVLICPSLIFSSSVRLCELLFAVSGCSLLRRIYSAYLSSVHSLRATLLQLISSFCWSFR